MTPEKPADFLFDAYEKWTAFPPDVQDDLGFALARVQIGKTPPRFSPLPQLGKGVAELKADGAGNTYRAFYVARFPEAVYVLDAVQKKSKRGKALPKQDADRIARRFKALLDDRRERGLQ